MLCVCRVGSILDYHSTDDSATTGIIDMDAINMDLINLDTLSLETLDMGPLGFKLPSFVTEALGLEPCVFTMWSTLPYAVLLGLFVSLAVRLRGSIFAAHYAKPGRTAPTRLVYPSAVPFESIIALLISLPRAYGLASQAMAEGTLDQITTEIASTSWLHWSLVAYILALDLFERYQWKNRTLKAYYTDKARVAQETQNALWQTKATMEDTRRQTSADDVEKSAESDAEPHLPRSLYRRILAAVASPQRQSLTAVNIAASYQVFAFSKILCATVFLLNTSTFSCMAAHAFGGSFGSTLPWAIITFIATYRGMELMSEGYRFTRAEVLTS